MKSTPFMNPNNPVGGAGRIPTAGRSSNSQQNDLTKLLPHVSDTERQSVREQIIEILQKEMSESQIQHIIEQNNMGGGGTTVDSGEYSDMNALEIAIQLETLIHAKYPDTSSPNYKALSKKIILSIKSKGEQRQQLLDIKEQSEIEDFLQMFLSTRARQPQSSNVQQQESAGSAASQQNALNPPGSTQSQSNPFAFAAARQGGGGPPPMQKKAGAGGPPNRFPQQRFTAGNMFQQTTLSPPTSAAVVPDQASQHHDGPPPRREIQNNQQMQSNLDEQRQLEANLQQNQQQEYSAGSGGQSFHMKTNQSLEREEEQKIPPRSFTGSSPNNHKISNNQNSTINANNRPYNNMVAESGAADSRIHSDYNPYSQKNISQNSGNNSSSNIQQMINPSQSVNTAAVLNTTQNTNQQFNDEFDFFQQLADKAVQQHKVESPIHHQTTNMSQNSISVHHPQNSQNSNPLDLHSQIPHQSPVSAIPQSVLNAFDNAQNNQNIQAFGSSGASNSGNHYHHQHVLGGGLGHTSQVQSHHPQHSQQEEQSRGYGIIDFEEEKVQSIDHNKKNNQEDYDSPQQLQRVNIQDQHENSQPPVMNIRTFNQRNGQEGHIFDAKVNLEQEEGLQTQFSPNNNSSDEKTHKRTDSRQNDFEHVSQELEEEQRHIQQVERQEEEFKIQPLNFHHEQAQEQNIDFDSAPQISSRTHERFDIPPHQPELTNLIRNNTYSDVSKQLPPKPLQSVHTSSFTDLHNTSKMTPSVRGFIPIQSSRPPQSVASVNITNLEDSESLIRAYKKKKAELEEFKQKFYDIETEFFIIKQKNIHLEEENLNLRQSLSRAEKNLKEVQLRESKNDRDLLQKQIQLKNNQIESYQKELQNQKSENQKLRDRIKELMSRSRQQIPLDPSQQNVEINQDLQRQNQELILQSSKYRQELENLRGEMQDIQGIYHQSQNTLNEQTQQQIAEMRAQLQLQKEAFESQIKTLQDQNKKQEEDIKILEKYKSEHFSPLPQDLHNQQDKQSEKSQSFVNLQKDHSSEHDESVDFAGYYESKSGSGSSSKNQAALNKAQLGSQSQQYPQSNINNFYFTKPHEENDKLSSAPPSQTKQQIQQQLNQISSGNQGTQSTTQVSRPVVQSQMKQNPNQQQLIGKDEGANFFDQLSQNFNGPKQVQTANQQHQRQQSQNQTGANLQSQQPQQQRFESPPTQAIKTQQLQQQVRPPQQQQPVVNKVQQPSNQYAAYDFTLDEISFTQEQQTQNKAPLQPHQPQQRPINNVIPQQQMQQFSVPPQRTQQPVINQNVQKTNVNAQTQQNQQQLQQQQRVVQNQNRPQQQPPIQQNVNNFANKYAFEMDETDTTPEYSSSTQGANIIPKSLFD